MTDERTSPGAGRGPAPEDRPAPEDGRAPEGGRPPESGRAPEDEQRPEAGRSLADNRVARIAGLAVLAAVVLGATVTGAVGVVFTALVLVPVLAAGALSLAGRGRESGWARVAAVAGLVLWLAVTGGLPMLLVVGAVVVMIFLHELGHYLAARWSGMKVTEFFLGFGTRIWSFRRGETEFGLKAIPAGAYVKIPGMNNLEEVDPADEPRTYRQAPFRNRLGVAVAGSAMHFLLALVLLVVQLAAFGRASEDRWVVGELTEGAAAEVAGVQEGDRIVTFDGQPVEDYATFRDQIRSASGAVPVVVERDGEQQTISVDLIQRAKVIGTVGSDVDVLEGPEGLVVGPLAPNGRGERAGLEPGQAIVAVGGSPVSDIDSLASAVAATEGGEVTFSVIDGTSGTSDVTVDLGSAVDTTGASAFLGIGAEALLEPEPLHRAVGSSVAEFGRGVGVSVAGIATVFNPPQLLGFFSSTLTGTDTDVTDEPAPAESVAVSSDAGRPISIFGAVAYGADLTSENLSNLIGFLIGLNIFIGVFNLIPLLPFDGGHVAIAVYEKAQEVRRRSRTRYIADVSRMIPVAYTVVMVLAVVGILAMYLDLTQGVSA